MSSSREPRAVQALLIRSLLALSGLGMTAGALAQTASAFPGIGRGATPAELAAWDIDVRPDFKGLPAGSGTVAAGMDVWESKCASCHGVFGESNEVFSPLVGGTTKDDVRTGRVARLTDPAYPGRTTVMKVATVSTLWDYINRAMPWTQPKSLKPDEVYAVTAYLLNMAGVLPDNFTLSNRNMAEVQALLPNRNGMNLNHSLWPGKGLAKGGKPDVQAVACMNNCATEATVASFLPDFARNAHGNLAEQNRLVGAQHGADTTRPAGAPAPTAPTTPIAAGTTPGPAASRLALAGKLGCSVCHGLENKIVGPAFRDIAKKYSGRGDSVDYLMGKIRAGGTGVWGAIPMPAQTLSDADAKLLAQWLADGAKK
jgi:S-disulfanyl-L-cysteine oxidoreductase SoxD